MNPLSIRFSGDIRVSTVADSRSQPERLQSLFTPPVNGEDPPYLKAQVPILEHFLEVSITEIKSLFERLKASVASSDQTPKLTIGHNLKTATIDYGENPELRARLHIELAKLGAKYIDTDGEVLRPASKWQLRNQFMGQFGLPIEREILKILKDQQLTVGVVESATGGLTSSRLTDIKGSSYCIQHNIVTYANEAKTRAVGVDADFLAEHGPYNERTAKEMAEGIIRETGAKVGLSFTGLAGCNRFGEEFSGVCFIGLAGLTPEPIIRRVQVDADLPRVFKKELFSEYGLMFLKQYLTGELQANASAKTSLSTHSSPSVSV